MIAKLASLFVFAAALPSALALTIDTPTNWQGNSTNNLTWTSAAGDPSVFSIELVNQQFGNSFALANNVNSSLDNLSIPLPQISQTGPGFTLEFVNISDINQVFATSGSFTIAEHDVAGSSSLSGSTVAPTASGSGAIPSATSPATSSAASLASSAASSASSVASSASSAASSASSAATSPTSAASLVTASSSTLFAVVAAFLGVVGF